jgi:hypothetical protein
VVVKGSILETVKSLLLSLFRCYTAKVAIFRRTPKKQGSIICLLRQSFMEWLNLEGIGDKKRNKKKQGSML